MTNEQIIKEFREKIKDILHEHCRKIITEGKDKPLIRRAIKNNTTEELLSFILQVRTDTINEIRKEVEKVIEATADDIQFACDNKLICQTKGHQRALILKTFLNKLDQNK